MQLTNEEQEMLSGKHGNAAKKSMEILAALGEIFGAKRFVPVTSVQVSGVSYDNLGDAGLEFLEELAKDGKVRVYTTLNPAGMDLENWQALGISKEFAEKQIKVIQAFAKMGIQTTCTCTPYLIGNRPKKGENIAWGESSAVTFANSVLGAKTNREGGPSALAAAITGKTPEYGLHLEENRQASVLVEVNAELNDDTDFGALGYVLGKKIGNKITLLKGIKKATEDQLKSLSAALPSWGGASVFHIEGITPNKTTTPNEKVTITQEELNNAKKEMNDDGEEVDFVLIGCPHCSIDELKRVSDLLNGKKVKKEMWIAMARPMKKLAEEKGYIQKIEASGAKIACDTCHAVAPLKGRFKCVATTSAKGVFYGRGKNGFKMKLMTLENCVKEATK